MDRRTDKHGEAKQQYVYIFVSNIRFLNTVTQYKSLSDNTSDLWVRDA
jgi:hypothetical protein